jgi:hypothetical protein
MSGNVDGWSHNEGMFFSILLLDALLGRMTSDPRRVHVKVIFDVKVYICWGWVR